MNTTKTLISIIVIVGLLAISLIGACTQPSPATAGKIGVVVSILPLAEFVESIGGDKVAVSVMIPPGADPHSYEPKPSQMTALANARMYVKVGSGVEFEITYMDKLASINKTMLIVDTSKDIGLIKSESEHENGHDNEQEHEHESGIDPHIWTSVRNAMIMAGNICSGLVQIDPENKAHYENNRDSFIDYLKKLDDTISTGLSTVSNRTFIVYHPSFSYFANDYNLTQISIEQEGKEPTAAYITHVIKEAKEKNCRVVFVSPQFSDKSASVIAKEINGAVVAVDTLAPQYIANMEKIIDAMIGAMK